MLAVADLERGDVNFDKIKIIAKAGGSIEDSMFIDGIVVDKEFSHPQMDKEIHNAKVVILTCPFEPPKPKTGHKLDVTTVEDYTALRQYEQKAFQDMVKQVRFIIILFLLQLALTVAVRIPAAWKPFAVMKRLHPNRLKGF